MHSFASSEPYTKKKSHEAMMKKEKKRKTGRRAQKNKV